MTDGTDAETKPLTNTALRALAEQCVQCGLCLPHCPTYRQGRVEAESPRGRIALTKALIDKPEAFDRQAWTHWDNCLSCGACQTACPSRVDFYRIAVETRHRAQAGRSEPRYRRWLRGLRRHPRAQRALATWALGPLGALAAKFGPRWVARLRKLAQVLPATPKPASATPTAFPVREDVTLFAGCLGGLVDADTVDAAQALLAHLGYRIRNAPPALCCGTWPLHAGDLDTAGNDAKRLRTELAHTQTGALLHLASGCDAALRAALASTVPVWEICAFLAQDAQRARLPWRAESPKAHVVVMVPCTQAVAGGAEPILRLLSACPKLKVTVLPQQPRCCGAAGMQFIDHVELSDGLRDEKLEQIQTLAPDVVLSNNHACRMHLRIGLRERGLHIPVIHPVVYVAELCR